MTTPFGDIEEESEVSDGKRKLNGDPGAIRWAASLPCACEASLRRERATPASEAGRPIGIRNQYPTVTNILSRQKTG